MMSRMRTTLTIDPDVAEALLEEQKRSQRKFKDVVNRALRAGLSAERKPLKKAKPFRVAAQHCGFRPGIDVGRLNQLADQLEVADFAAEAKEDSRSRTTRRVSR